MPVINFVCIIAASVAAFQISVAIVCTQLTGIAMDVALGYPGESQSLLLDSGCLWDEAHIGSRSITVKGQITVPGKQLERLVFCRVPDRGGKFLFGSSSQLCPCVAWWPWSTASLNHVFPTLLLFHPICMSALHCKFYGARAVLWVAVTTLLYKYYQLSWNVYSTCSSVLTSMVAEVMGRWNISPLDTKTQGKIHHPSIKVVKQVKRS